MSIDPLLLHNFKAEQDLKADKLKAKFENAGKDTEVRTGTRRSERLHGTVSWVGSVIPQSGSQDLTQAENLGRRPAFLGVIFGGRVETGEEGELARNKLAFKHQRGGSRSRKYGKKSGAGTPLPRGHRMTWIEPSPENWRNLENRWRKGETGDNKGR